MPLRIAIDLDNTIIDYGPLLHDLAREQGWIPPDGPREKAAIRAALVRGSDDRRWQALQASAYGTHIDRATIAPGVVDFVDRTRQAGHDVFILSHKSERSHFDPSVELRGAALRWLTAHELLRDDRIPRAAVHFFDDRDAKVRAVAELAIDWLIDDLREVLEHPLLPAGTQRIWFHPVSAPVDLARCATFAEIDVLRELWDALGAVPSAGLREALGPSPRAVASLPAGGNAALRLVQSEDGSRRVVKSYARRGGGRAEREHRALRWLRAVGVEEVPTPLFVDTRAELAVLSYLDGRRPGPENADDLADACADFILRIDAKRGEAGTAFGEASEARPTLASYPAAITRRLATVVAGAEHPRAKALLHERIEPLVTRELAAFARRVADSGLDPELALEDGLRLPSPSDFGLHNMIVDRYDRLSFVDFEYFGWDDPAKLMADFRHSVAHALPAAARERFIDRLVAGLAGGVAARRRLDVVSDLVRLEWILIVLNVQSEERLERAERMAGALA